MIYGHLYSGSKTVPGREWDDAHFCHRDPPEPHTHGCIRRVRMLTALAKLAVLRTPLSHMGDSAEPTRELTTTTPPEIGAYFSLAHLVPRQFADVTRYLKGS